MDHILFLQPTIIIVRIDVDHDNFQFSLNLLFNISDSRISHFSKKMMWVDNLFYGTLDARLVVLFIYCELLSKVLMKIEGKIYSLGPLLFPPQVHNKSGLCQCSLR